MFAELAGIVPARWPMVNLCREVAADFFFRFLVRIFPQAKFADLLAAKRSSFIPLEQALTVTAVLYPPDDADQTAEVIAELTELSHEAKVGVAVRRPLDVSNPASCLFLSVTVHFACRWWRLTTSWST